MLALVVTPPSDVLEGQPISGTIATFDPSDLEGTFDENEILAQVDWGDGTTSTARVAPASGESEIRNVVVPESDAHVYKNNNTYTLTVVVPSTGEGVAEDSAPIAIAPTKPEGTAKMVTATVRTRFNDAVANFTDANLDESPANFAASIDWGDGAISPGVVQQDGPGQFRVLGSHVYSTVPVPSRPLDLRVTVREDGVPEALVLEGQAVVGQTDSFVLTPLSSRVPANVPFSGIVIGTIEVIDSNAVGEDDFRVNLTPSETFPGDNTPLLTVSLSPRNGNETTVFNIVASGQYYGVGIDRAKLTVTRISTGETSEATVEIRADRSEPIALAGRLTPFTDTGASNQDAITSTPFPVFAGTAAPHSVILLYGRRLDHKVETLLGRTVTTVNGNWQLKVGPIPDGSYTIRAVESVPTTEHVPVYLYDELRPLTIDTVGLAIAKVERVPSLPGLRVYFLPDTSGFEESTLLERTNYSIERRPTRFGLPTATAKKAQLGASVSGYLTVDLTFDRRDAWFARRLSVEGLKDKAGNPLGGQFPVTTHAFPTRVRPFGLPVSAGRIPLMTWFRAFGAGQSGL
ncbi:Ig-like domain-containing protein [Tautonia marina]|uniref:Ig-like domain-containing protein n=1 Tax=Tautonia marina TaxID=2653855 RepID=UPI001375E9DE|nr:Ig-like domain-containing protein [Tautonia marina]